MNAVEYDIDLPLVVACKKGNYELVKCLLENGSDPNKFLEGNFSPIEAAFVNRNENRFSISKELISYGADVDLCGSGQTALFCELSSNLYIDSLSETEQSTMSECVTLLLDNGACPINSKGNSVIHYLAFIDEIELMSELNTDYKDLFNSCNEKGESPLIWAVRGNSAQAVEYLLKMNVNSELADKEGKTALDYAIESGNEEIIALLSD